MYALTYPFNLGCLAVTKLLVLDRLMDFSKLKGDGTSVWVKAARGMVYCVVVGNVAGLISNIVTSVFFARAAQSYETSVSDSLNNSSHIETARAFVTQGSRAASVHIAFETVMLILIVIAIAVVGFKCALRIRAALNAIKGSQLVKLTSMFGMSSLPTETSIDQQVHTRLAFSGQKMNHQIGITCSAVFLSFLLRACFTVMFTLCTALQNNISRNLCQPYINRCSSCYNVYSLIIVWIFYSPEFFFIIVLISQPFTLLVALWGMTSDHTLEIMKLRKTETKKVNF